MLTMMTCTALNATALGEDIKEQDTKCLATALMSEASVGTYEERVAVAWTIFNRVSSSEFPNSICDVINQRSQYATNQEPTSELLNLSEFLIANRGNDPTRGAIYFFSPRSMPKVGEDTNGYDVGGGLHDIAGIDKKVNFPSFTLTQEYVGDLQGVRPAYYMFYREQVKPSKTNARETSQLLISDMSFTQPVTWKKTFGGAGNDIGTSVQQTTDGGYIITGTTIGASPCNVGGVMVCWLIKTDANGNVLWDKKFNESSVGTSVQQTIDGGYAVSGMAGDCQLIKTDDNGNILWKKSFGFGGLNNYLDSSLQQTTDGGYILSCFNRNFIWMFKTDVDGNLTWHKIIEGTTDPNFCDPFGKSGSVQQTKDGGYVITGILSRQNNLSYGQYCRLIKADADGNVLWDKIFGNSSFGECTSVRQTDDGGYIMTGMASSSGWSICLIKADRDGNELWNKRLRGSSSGVGYSVQQTNDGGYVITGSICTNGACGCSLIKTDDNGNELWNKTYGDSGNDRGLSVQQTKDGGFVITGIHNVKGSANSQDSSVWLIKTDADGNVIPSDEDSSIRLKSVDTKMPKTDRNPTSHEDVTESLQKTPDFAGILTISALICAFVLSRKD